LISNIIKRVRIYDIFQFGIANELYEIKNRIITLIIDLYLLFSSTVKSRLS
jgi:hypothetical protein